MPDAEGVTRPGLRWDPLRSLDLLAGTGVSAAYLSLFVSLRRLLIGRRLTLHTADGDVVLTVEHLVARLDRRSVTGGRLGGILLVARDVRWRGHHVHRASAVLHDVHLRPPVVVAAPVEVTVDLAAPALDHLFGIAAPRLSGVVGDDAVARLSLNGRSGSGHLEVDARLDGSTVWITPRAVVRRRRWRLPGLLPAYRLRVPELPGGAELTHVEFAPGVLRLTGVLPQRRIDLPRAALEGLVTQLGAVGSRPLAVVWPPAAPAR